ncbi:UNVERIFIED_CONTAM: hypothetical protein K2H54_036860 [Gekko kuhli]
MAGGGIRRKVGREAVLGWGGPFPPPPPLKAQSQIFLVVLMYGLGSVRSFVCLPWEHRRGGANRRKSLLPPPHPEACGSRLPRPLRPSFTTDFWLQPGVSWFESVMVLMNLGNPNRCTGGGTLIGDVGGGGRGSKETPKQDSEGHKKNGRRVCSQHWLFCALKFIWTLQSVGCVGGCRNVPLRAPQHTHTSSPPPRGIGVFA